jgi:hypothetical protein
MNIDELLKKEKDKMSTKFLNKYFEFIDDDGYEKKLNELNKNHIINENNIHIINLFIETDKIKEFKNILLDNDKYKFSIEEINSPFNKSMYFIMALFIVQIQEPKFKKILKNYQKKFVFNDEEKEEIKSTNRSNSFINSCFHMVSLLEKKNQKKFINDYIEHGYIIVILIYASYILYQFEYLPTYKLFTEFDIEENLFKSKSYKNLKKLLLNKKLWGKLFFLYLNISPIHTDGIINPLENLLIRGNFGTDLNISKYLNLLNEKISYIDFFEKANFGGNKKKNFTRNLEENSKHLIENKVNKLIYIIKHKELKGGMVGGAFVPERIKKELDKLNVKFQEVYTEYIEDDLKITSYEDKIKFLKERKIVLTLGNNRFTLEDIYNFKNSYITDFLLELFLSHNNTKIEFGGKERNIAGRSYKKIGDNTGQFNIRDGTKYIFTCCEGFKFKEILNKPKVKEYRGGIISDENRVHLVLKVVDLDSKEQKGDYEMEVLEKVIIENPDILTKKKGIKKEEKKKEEEEKKKEEKKKEEKKKEEKKKEEKKKEENKKKI